MNDVILEYVVEQVEAWTLELAGWRDRVAGVFTRPEPREIFAQLVAGLLSSLPKKNGWTLAEYAGHTHPGRVQTFLCRGAWEAGDLESRVRDLVVEEMGDPDAVLIVDDTQMIKKGSKSVGVAPQHCGATNQVENCQVVVMLTYAAAGGHAFIGHRLYLPERWTSDPVRCREAGIPKDVSFATKPEQAVELLQEADDAQVPFGWVAVDGGYGQYLRHEVARGEWVRRLEGRDVVDGVTSSLCLWLVPTVTCVAGDGWVRSSRESPRAPVPSGGHRRGEGWVWGD
jgi:SRSO17 transposase